MSITKELTVYIHPGHDNYLVFIPFGPRIYLRSCDICKIRFDYENKMGDFLCVKCNFDMCQTCFLRPLENGNYTEEKLIISSDDTKSDLINNINFSCPQDYEDRPERTPDQDDDNESLHIEEKREKREKREI
jgi:hypothetical protein